MNGVHLRRLPPFTTLLVQTANSLYRLVITRGPEVYVQGGVFFPDLTSAYVEGSSGGGSAQERKRSGNHCRQLPDPEGATFDTREAEEDQRRRKEAQQQTAGRAPRGESWDRQLVEPFVAPRNAEHHREEHSAEETRDGERGQGRVENPEEAFPRKPGQE